jgi:hypothetical protein
MTVDFFLAVGLLALLVYSGLYMLAFPSLAIRALSGWMLRLHEFEVSLTRDDFPEEPNPIEDTLRTQAIMRAFGVGFVISSLVEAAVRLNAL